jgi:hypothetical protein
MNYTNLTSNFTLPVAALPARLKPEGLAPPDRRKRELRKLANLLIRSLVHPENP